MMTKFLFYTDTHLTGKQISSRSDDYAESVLRKMRQCYDHAKEIGCDFLVCGGDVFNTHRIFSYDVIMKARDIIMSSGLDSWFIAGNHDVYGLSINYYGQSALAFLENICDGRFKMIRQPVEAGCVVLHPCHTWNDPDYCLRNGPDDGRFNVLVMHHLLDRCDASNPYTELDTRKYGETAYRLVLSGDLHSGYATHSFGHTTYCNPGALARTSVANISRLPKAAVCTVDGGELSIEDYFPVCAPGEKVFKENLFDGVENLEMDKEQLSSGVSEMEESFKELKSRSSDLFTLIGEFAKKSDVEDSVVEYISKFRKESL